MHLVLPLVEVNAEVATFRDGFYFKLYTAEGHLQNLMLGGHTELTNRNAKTLVLTCRFSVGQVSLKKPP